ncbi:DUF2442 domain-containing protein [Fusibacter paucivorans]|uniref:DUF2442 domain-containing protein n=1 Tax=Fusibacter paucivorans TaxID=76009 RepID=A0ABS5PJP1_9FIRM|nr:DUF2442 domain-containing protein [Fusibacter paucivorans]MBS7525360.1 DUF2442 domain-containing protein [Fusibacter paucivorans]
MTKIIELMPKDDFTLYIELSNHHKIIYDIKPRLHTIRFMMLRDLELFRKARIENGNTVVWDAQCQLTIDEIMTQIKR